MFTITGSNPNEQRHPESHEYARMKNMVIMTCSHAPTPASQLEENMNPPMMVSAAFWQLSALSSLPNQTLQTNSKAFAGPRPAALLPNVSPCPLFITRAVPLAAASLGSARSHAQTLKKLVGATKQAGRENVDGKGAFESERKRHPG